MASAPTPDLLQSFLDEAWEAVTVFEQTPEFLAIGRHEPLVVFSHRLKGSAGLYGFRQTSGLGALIERILEGAPKYTQSQSIKVIEFMAQATACLIEALERIAVSGKEGTLGLELGRLGAAQLIQALALENPAAFDKSHPEPLETLPTPQTRPQASLVAELEHFYKENAEFWEFFAPETQEHLESASNLLSEMLGTDPSSETIQSLFRSMHTIKGAAFSVGCKPIGDFAHKLEDLMVEVREGRQAWSSDHNQILLVGVSAIEKMLQVAEGKNQQARQDLGETVQTLQRRIALMLGHEPEPEAEPQIEAVVEAKPEQAPKPEVAPAPRQIPQRGSVRVSLDKLDLLLNMAGETVVSRSRLDLLLRRFEDLDSILESARLRLQRTTADFETRYLNPRLSLQSDSEGENTASSQTSLGKTVQELFSELEFDRYDDLNILARSIGEMSSDLSEVRNTLSNHIESFRQETESFGKLTHNLRSEINRARLITIGRFYNRLQRQVQQVSGDKKVELITLGETIEIDSVLLDGMAEALVHLVNNAVIHGLETPDERTAKGKSPQGQLTVRTFQQRHNLVLEIQDDGRGINLEAIKRQAISRGLRTPEQVAALSDEEALQLIFLPGLSTASSITDVAGRGVGMDAVANTIRRLRGDLSVETRPDLGSTFRLRIPQNLVVSDVLLLEVSGQTLALPRESVLALLTADASATQVDYDDSPIAIKPLHQLLGFQASNQSTVSLAVVEGRGETIALAADRLIGIEQTLVKPLTAPVSELPHLVGATVSASGEVIIVLSPSGLLSIGSNAYTSQTRVAARAEVQAPILLVDDSLSVRKVVGQMLRRAGHLVITASDGQEALELLEQQNFRAVVTDLEMPRMSGFELLEEVRRRPNLVHLPVAVLTTRASSKHRDLAVELGANAYLTKPADELELDKFLRGG